MSIVNIFVVLFVFVLFLLLLCFYGFFVCLFCLVFSQNQGRSWIVVPRTNCLPINTIN